MQDVRDGRTAQVAAAVRFYGRIVPGVGVSVGPLGMLIVGPLVLLYMFVAAMVVLVRVLVAVAVFAVAAGTMLVRRRQQSKATRTAAAAVLEATAAVEHAKQSISQDYNGERWNAGEAAAQGLVGTNLVIEAERARRRRTART